MMTLTASGLRAGVTLLLAGALTALVGCAGPQRADLHPGAPLAASEGSQGFGRAGQEIMVAGQLFHVGAPVVLWTDPGGYDAYRVENRFGPLGRSSWETLKASNRDPARYSPRFFRISDRQPAGYHGAGQLSDAEIIKYRGGGWDLPGLQRVVDQFVLHYDVCGVSKQCFRILHDVRGLSVHFMIDIDGTIYQTLDLKERTFHATSSNDRSVGVEIANMGAYADGERSPLAQWYTADSRGGVRITIPETLGDGGVRTPNFVGRPIRPDPVRGVVQGKERTQYDLTPEQYDSLIRLTAALCTIFPNMPADYPRGPDGQVVPHVLDDSDLRAFRGVIGHYHIQDDKSDPGPALQWEFVITKARELMPESARGPRLPTIISGDEPATPAPAPTTSTPAPTN
jgi:N-acetylmuramoyl-L-alanine amidase